MTVLLLDKTGRKRCKLHPVTMNDREKARYRYIMKRAGYVLKKSNAPDRLQPIDIGVDDE